LAFDICCRVAYKLLLETGLKAHTETPMQLALSTYLIPRLSVVNQYIVNRGTNDLNVGLRVELEILWALWLGSQGHGG